jgi:hypothetical protein
VLRIKESRKIFFRSKPVKWTHRAVVGSALVPGELGAKIGEREEAVFVVEKLLVFTMAAFDLTVVTRRIRANAFVANAKFLCCYLEKGPDITFRV